MKILYKYQPLNSDSLKIFTDNELYFSFPKQFNDPYDCYARTDYEGNEEEWINFFKKHQVSDDIRENILYKLRSCNFNKTFFNEKFGNISKNENVDMFVLNCFTELNDNFLMWSHYTNKHNGICIGFKIKELQHENYTSYLFEFNEEVAQIENILSKNNGPVYKVNYSKNLPKPYNGIRDNPLETLKFIITKSKDWEYEKEWRCILQYKHIDKQSIKYKPEILHEVIFGLRTPLKDQENVINIIEKEYIAKGIEVKLRKAVQSHNEYKLEFEDLN